MNVQPYKTTYIYIYKAEVILVGDKMWKQLRWFEYARSKLMNAYVRWVNGMGEVYSKRVENDLRKLGRNSLDLTC